VANIYDTALKFRADILKKESQTAVEMIRYYGKSYSEIEKNLATLQNVIAEARASGVEISENWLQREKRYKELLRQIDEQMKRFSSFNTSSVTAAQETAVGMALDASKDTVLSAFDNLPKRQATVAGNWNRVPKESLERYIGTLQDGSPLKDLFDNLGSQYAERAKQTLATSIVRGDNPRTTAKLLREDFGGNLTRALTVARTEQLRSYRGATLDSYRANDDVVEGWERLETLDDLTCVICIEECGKFYSLETDFETHPNCRGTLVPKVKGIESKVPDGKAWFENQDEDYKKEVLGDAKYEAYSNKEITLTDLVARTESERWGGGRRERSLEDAKQVASERQDPNDISVKVPDNLDSYKQDFNNRTEDVWREKGQKTFEGTKMPYSGWDQKETGRLDQEKYLLEWEKVQGPATSKEREVVKEIQGWDGYKKVSEDPEMKKTLDDMMDKYTAPENFVVYHGVNITPEQLQSFNEGKVKEVSQPVLSTSLSSTTASGYMRNAEYDDKLKSAGRTEGVMYKIYLPEGSPAIPVEGISPRNGYGISEKNLYKNTASILGEIALPSQGYVVVGTTLSEKGVPIISLVPKLKK